MARWTIKDFKEANEFGLTIGEDGFSMDLEGKPIKDGRYNRNDEDLENHPYCVTKGNATVKPSNWKIIGTNPAPGFDHLLVFYMLPQRASRIYNKGEIITDKSPDGPNCTELYIEFVRNFKFFE